MTETSISIDEELLAEARKVAGTTTNQAAIDHALRDLVEREGAAVVFDRIVERELGDTKITLEF
ncbi:type II toxin-antitoxin system VapB family antitoxin [Nocardioides sp. NPDC006273]|uniref:type II toxin-antitoxin system VapB family antitoxin n=1 Tax=Nocardioides sp. NPDC006273 TaxID=3155598 RepID=UPI0033AD54CD